MADIVIKMPGKDTPGYFRRQREAAAFTQEFSQRQSPEAIDRFIDWLLKTAVLVEVPDGVDPHDAILDMTQNEVMELMTAAGGGESAVDPQNGG